MKNNNWIYLELVLPLLGVGILTALPAIIWSDPFLTWIDSFLTTKDILHALLVLTTLIMGFIFHQFFSVLLNSHDRLLQKFIKPDEEKPNNRTKSFYIYTILNQTFLICSFLLIANILYLFKDCPLSFFKFSLVALILTQIWVFYRLFHISMVLVNWNLDNIKKDE